MLGAFQGSFFADNILWVTICVFVVYTFINIVYNLYFHPLSSIPGPPSWSCSRLPFIWSLLQGTIVHDFERMHRKYGPVLRIAPNEVTFAKEEAWNDIFQPRPNHHVFLKDPLWWSSQPGHPDSIINAINPETHAKIRKILTPGFTPRALRSQEPIVQRYVNLLMERLEDQIHEAAPAASINIDITPWLNFTTFDIFGDLGFGESFDCLQHSRYHPWIALLFNSVKAASFIVATRYYPLLELLLMKCIPPSLKKMQRDHYQQIVDKVDRRLNWEVERPDIMSHVIQQGFDGNGLSSGEISATFMVLTTAGSETTATTLCGAVNHLASHTEHRSRLAAEIRGTFQSREEIRLDALRDLPYLNAVLREALRLCPAIPWMLPRQVPVDGDTVCGIWLPGGTPVSIQSWSLNRDPHNFYDATTFEPERWLPKATTDPSSPYHHDRREALQPFSVGPRSCMGQHLAWAEMRLILAKLIWSFDFEAVEGKQVRWEDLRTFLLVEKRPIMIRLKMRLH